MLRNVLKKYPCLLKKNEWLKEVDSCLLRCSIFNLEDGFKRYKNKLGNKKYILKYERKIKGLNRWLARTKVGSKNRYKVKKKLLVVYKKLKNARKYLLYSISNKLVKENDIVVTETLKISDMVQNKHLSKYILDTSWYELIRQLKYKCMWKNKKLYQIDPYYPSSQICSHCDYKFEKVKDLSIRKWECPRCSSTNDRDINASINIMFEGIKKYMKNCKSTKILTK